MSAYDSDDSPDETRLADAYSDLLDILTALDNIGGFNAGDNIGVMMDSGSYFNTTIAGPPTALGINIARPMPGYAAQGNVVTDYEAAGP